MLYPLLFRPIFKERIWGGRELERLYGKRLPPKALIGESWEVSDRPGDVSVVENGPLRGKNLHELTEQFGRDLLGDAPLCDGRFPLLVKLLDAREKLSLQVHPPAGKAAELGGQPKTEMWYIAQADPSAELYVGLRKGVTRREFEETVCVGGVSECFQRLPVKAGDAMFLPSGRVHAIGAGLVIYEIQQNSDTTYRVYDWDRAGLDGKPRQLHIRESLESIDFSDIEPALVASEWREQAGMNLRTLVQDPLFNVMACQLPAGPDLVPPEGIMQVIGAVRGELVVHSANGTERLAPGSFCLIPASAPQPRIRASGTAEFLHVTVTAG